MLTIMIHMDVGKYVDTVYCTTMMYIVYTCTGVYSVVFHIPPVLYTQTES